MSNLKMNCGYCGRKCSLDKDFCIPQDSVYICKSCYDWKQKVDDLEAKLVKNRKWLASNEGFLENQKLKQQLAEKDKEHELLIDDFEKETENLRKQIKEESDARKRLVEKVRQQKRDLKDKQEQIQEYISKYRYWKTENFMTKNQTAIAELEKVKEYNKTLVYSSSLIDKFIEQQIRVLKGEE